MEISGTYNHVKCLVRNIENLRFFAISNKISVSLGKQNQRFREILKIYIILKYLIKFMVGHKIDFMGISRTKSHIKCLVQ